MSSSRPRRRRGHADGVGEPLARQRPVGRRARADDRGFMQKPSSPLAVEIDSVAVRVSLLPGKVVDPSWAGKSMALSQKNTPPRPGWGEGLRRESFAERHRCAGSMVTGEARAQRRAVVEIHDHRACPAHRASLGRSTVRFHRLGSGSSPVRFPLLLAYFAAEFVDGEEHRLTPKAVGDGGVGGEHCGAVSPRRGAEASAVAWPKGENG